MFHNIYREPLTRIQGSAWIQANIPADIAISHRGRAAGNSVDQYRIEQ